MHRPTKSLYVLAGAALAATSMAQAPDAAPASKGPPGVDGRAEPSAGSVLDVAREREWEKVEDARLPTGTRVELLRGLLAGSSSRERPVLLEHARGWLRAIAAIDSSTVSSSRQYVFEFDALRALVDHIALPTVAESFGEAAGAGELLAGAMAQGLYSGCGEASRRGVDIVAIAGRLPARERTAFAQTVVRRSSFSIQIDDRVCELLEPEFEAVMLAAIAAASGDDPTRVPYGYGYALGHLGTAGAAGALRNLADDVARPRPSDNFATHARPRLAEQLRRYARMADVKADPRGALAILAEAPALGGPGGSDAWLRQWALRRAVQSGLDRAAVAAAIREHAGKVRPLTSRPSTPKAAGRWVDPSAAELAELKRAAVEAGVLTEADLPDVQAVPSLNPDA